MDHRIKFSKDAHHNTNLPINIAEWWCGVAKLIIRSDGYASCAFLDTNRIGEDLPQLCICCSICIICGNGLQTARLIRRCDGSLYFTWRVFSSRMGDPRPQLNSNCEIGIFDEVAKFFFGCDISLMRADGFILSVLILIGHRGSWFPHGTWGAGCVTASVWSHLNQRWKGDY